MLLEQYYIIRRHEEAWFDLFLFSTINVVVFGLIARYLADKSDPNVASSVILGMLLWEVVRIAQYCITINSLWELWSRNLANIFITPISIFEYVLSYAISSLFLTGTVFISLGIVARLFFNFDVTDIGLAVLPVAFVELFVFAWAIGVVLVGLIFRFGTRINAISWGAIFLLQPLSATFFPVAVLPRPVQIIARGLPTTYVFEEARRALVLGHPHWSGLGIAFVLDAMYLTLGCAVFSRLYRSARVSGQFARSDV